MHDSGDDAVNERTSTDPRVDELERKISRDPTAAVHELRLLIADAPLNVAMYRMLANALAEQRSRSGAGLTTQVSGADQLLQRASQALAAGDLETAEVILRERLIQRPTDVLALVLFARLARALAYHSEADQLVALALEFEPDCTFARIDNAMELQRQNRSGEALEELERVLEREPSNIAVLTMKAAALYRAAQYPESLALYEQLLQGLPREAGLWSSYGNVLKTVGRFDEGQRALRKATEIAPSWGEAWWNLANLKLNAFSVEDLQRMQAAVEDAATRDQDRMHLHFALGKANEDLNRHELAFRHYAEANRLRKQTLGYDPGEIEREVDEFCKFFTASFFEDRRGWGADATGPIFVVGMPRAGSTLVEQILASHSEIEATMELPDMAVLARAAGRGTMRFPHGLAELSPESFQGMGEGYLRRTRPHRREGRPFFIDKMPNNWLFVPLIHLILPNAKIIDVRRHPMACGFSNFKQHFALGQAFSYDLEWFGRYYRDYIRLMDHVDQVLPGRVHRVIYEQLVRDPDAEIRELLDHVGVEFEESCLRFYENKRAVTTPSSEQVRQPLNPAGLDQWRNFESWLDPLRRALGPVADVYPAVPTFSD
jgi:tetratricopeptide (TPR) repeat protein